jgi:hypothetical protein
MVDVNNISREDAIRFEDSQAIGEGMGTVLRTHENAVDVNPNNSKHNDIVVSVDDITWHQPM